MSIYPKGYPDQRVIVDGVDLTAQFQLILIDGFNLEPPQPKLYTIKIPGGNGVIDLTEALGGDVAYENREQDFTFKLIYPDGFETTKTKLSNFLHGKFYKYQLTWDPGYTYKGRFTVSSYGHTALAKGKLGEIVVHVSADPYKYKEQQVFRINASGGQTYYFRSGRKPVRPILQTTRPTHVIWKNNAFQVGTGAFRLNNVLFQEGMNEIYFNTYGIYTSEWDDVGKGGSYNLTWEEAKKYTWDQFQRINLDTGTPATDTAQYAFGNPIVMLDEFDDEEGGRDVDVYGSFFMKAYSWGDLLGNSVVQENWGTIRAKGWTWDGLNYDPGNSSGGSGQTSSGSGSIGGGGSSWSGGNSSTEWDYGELPDMHGAIAVISYEWGDL